MEAEIAKFIRLSGYFSKLLSLGSKDLYFWVYNTFGHQVVRFTEPIKVQKEDP